MALSLSARSSVFGRLATASLRALPLLLLFLASWSGCGVTTAPKCDFQTCTGCCDAEGECQPGFAANACGVLGETCQSCTGAICHSGICTAANTGGGGSTGGGTGGGSTGGGTGGGMTTGGGTGGGSTGGGTGGGSTGGGTGGGSTGGGTGGGVTTGGGTGGGTTGGGTGGGTTGGGSGTTQPGDDCGNATPLTFDTTGTASFNGDNSLHANDGQGTCGDSRDRVFSFTLAAPTWVEVSSTGLLAYHLRTDCTAPASEAWCGSSVGSRLLPAGTHFLWAEASGTYSLRVRLLPGETCDTATEILTGTTTSTVMGTLASYRHHVQAGACGATSGPDRAYTFTLAAGQNFTAELTEVNGFGGWLVLQSLANGCANPTQTMCQTGGLNNGFSLRRSGLPAGRYVLWVKGTTSGTFTLTTSLTNAIVGDSCASAIPLTFSSGQASATGDFRTYFNNSNGCSTARGNDAFYVFTLPSAAVLDVELQGSGLDTSPVLSLRSGCGNSLDIACDEETFGSPGARFTTTLSAGTYYLVVDNEEEDAGNFTLTATTRPLPPAVDDCSSVDDALLSTSGTVTTTGNTNVFASNYRSGVVNACDSSGTGADGVYMIEHPTRGDLTATITATSSAYRPIMYLRSTCLSAATDTACAGDCSNSSASITATGLAAGTYYLIVDTCNSATGPYMLTVTQ